MKAIMKLRMLFAALAVFVLLASFSDAAVYTPGQEQGIKEYGLIRDPAVPYYPADKWIEVDFADEMPENTVTDDDWYVYFPDANEVWQDTNPPVLHYYYDDFYGFWVYSVECDQMYYFASSAFFGAIVSNKVTNATVLGLRDWVWDDVKGKWLQLECFPHGFRCGVDPGNC